MEAESTGRERGSLGIGGGDAAHQGEEEKASLVKTAFVALDLSTPGQIPALSQLLPVLLTRGHVHHLPQDHPLCTRGLTAKYTVSILERVHITSGLRPD